MFWPTPTGISKWQYHVLTTYVTYNDLYGISNESTFQTIGGPLIQVTGGLPGGRIRFRSQDGGIAYLEQPDVVTNGQLSVQVIMVASWTIMSDVKIAITYTDHIAISYIQYSAIFFPARFVAELS